MYRGCSRCLEGEPFLQASTAEGVEAVEECERLVEEIGADLRIVSRRIPALQSKSTAKEATMSRMCRSCFLVHHSVYHIVLCLPIAASPPLLQHQPQETDINSPNMSIPSLDRPARRYPVLPLPLRCDSRSSLAKSAVCQFSSWR